MSRSESEPIRPRYAESTGQAFQRGRSLELPAMEQNDGVGGVDGVVVDSAHGKKAKATREDLQTG